MGLTFSKFYTDALYFLTPQNIHLAPFQNLDTFHDDDEVFITPSSSSVSQDVNFRSLKDHPEAVDKLTTVIASEQQLKKDIVVSLVLFIENYIDTDILKRNSFSKKIWEKEFGSTREYVEDVFHTSIKKKVTLGKLIQNVVQNTAMGEFSGFKILDDRTSPELVVVSYMNQIKQQNMEYHIGKAFDGVESGVMFLTEYDHKPLNISGLDFVQVDLVGNRSKAIISKNETVEVIPFQTIYERIVERHKGDDDVMDCINDEDVKEMFCLFKIGDVHYLGVHLKSNSNYKSAKKNVNLYITAKCIVDWLKELKVELFVLGDFNIPFLDEDTYLGFTKADEKWHPIQDPPKEHCINYGMRRLCPKHADVVVQPKMRKSDCVDNAQGSIGKFYEDGRFGLTDFTFHYVPPGNESCYVEPVWTCSISTQETSIKCIPYICDDPEKSFCSDHQYVKAINGIKMVGTWNVLSMDCSDSASYKTELSAETVEGAKDELAEILRRIYNAV